MSDQLDTPWRTRAVDRAIFEAAAKFSTAADRMTAALERIEQRPSVPAPAHDPRMEIARLVITVSVAALVASCTVLIWVAT